MTLRPQNNGIDPEGQNDAHGQDDDQDVRTFLGFLRWNVDDDRPVTDAEAEYILRATQDLEVPEDQVARVREAMRRNLGMGPEGDTAAEKEEDGAAAAAPSSPRPSIFQQCRALRRKVAEVAQALHLDKETLLRIDRGEARSVPAILITSAARTLGLQEPEIAPCFAVARGDVQRMAAHGRPGAELDQPEVYDFLEIIEESRLPESEKRYWREVVAAEERT
jgi:hypothetical protein